MKPLNSVHLLVLKNLSVIKRCPLLGGSLTKTVTFWTKHLGLFKACPLFGGFIVITVIALITGLLSLVGVP